MRKIKDEKGSITIFVLTAMLLFLVVAVGIYVYYANSINNQKRTISSIQDEYSADNIDQVYENLTTDNFSSEYCEKYNDENGQTAYIPNGFYVVPGKENIAEGLVISDNEEDTEIDGETTVAKGNQFVWIPVETAVAETETDGTTNKAMAIEQDGDYRGLLYDFTTSGSTVKEGCTTTTEEYREPAFHEGLDDNTSYNAGLFTESSMQDDYNSMIESVSYYKGFYVARYELGLEGTNPVSKNASTNTGVTTTDATNEETKTWYGLYGKCKEFATEDDTNSSVVSSMMWGSQYDAMMNWMIKQNIDVRSNRADERNTTQITGSSSTDNFLNIYDLCGGHLEWTLEATEVGTKGYRFGRGGYYNEPGANTANPSSRVNNVFPQSMGTWPYVEDTVLSSRITLFIKL